VLNEGRNPNPSPPAIGETQDLADGATAECLARYRALVESSPDMIYEVDFDGQVLFVNASAAAAIGFDAKSVVGKRLREIFPEVHATGMLQSVRRVIETGKVLITERATIMRGQAILISAVVVPVRSADGEVHSALGISRDISEHHRLEEALRRSEELLRAERDLALRLADVSSLNDALDACLEVAIRVTQMDSGAIGLVNEEGGLDVAAYRGLSEEFMRPLIHLDGSSATARGIAAGRPIYTHLDHMQLPPGLDGRKEGLRAFAMLPIAQEGRPVAGMALCSRTLDEVPAFARDAIEAIAAQIGTAIVRIRAQEELRRQRQALRQLLDTYEKHRQLVSYEIHDGVAQPLTAAMMGFEVVLAKLRGNVPADTYSNCENALGLLRISMAEARQLMSGLRPAVLDDFGVVAAVDHLVSDGRTRTGVTIDWSHQVQFRRLAPPLETALYRILQEGLTNALRHSQSDHVRMRLAQDGDWLTLQVEDQGIGFRPEDVPPDRFGLQGIRERARLFGGQAMIHSELGQGTRIVVVLPVVEMEEDQPAGALSE